MAPIEFQAPWGRALKIATVVSVTILGAIALVGYNTGPRQLLVWNLAMTGIPLLILISALPFMVRGYLLTENEIRIKRLGWSTRLPLKTLTAVEGNVEAMQGSIRLFGNGGLFSLTGYYWNRRLKLYRALATDPSRAVILRYPDRVIVITPHDPQHFIMRARTLLKSAAFAR